MFLFYISIAYVEFSSESEATSIYKSSKGGIDVDGANVYIDYARDRNSDGGRGGTYSSSYLSKHEL